MTRLSSRSLTRFSPARRSLAAALAATLAFGSGLPALAATAAAPAKVLFVVDVKMQPRLRAIDEHLRAHIASLGYAVTEVNEDVPISAAEGMDLVVISTSVSAQNVEDRFKDLAVPIVTWESYILYHMHMTGKVKEVDYAAERKEEMLYLDVVNAAHPLAAGAPNGLLKVYRRPLPDQQTNWGRPAPGATVVATLPGEPDKSGLFCYEKGAVMDSDFIAPARRVMLFLHTDTFDELTDAGLRIFDASLRWALGRT